MTEEQKKALDSMMQGQIWEECGACGEEPVYLPHFLCETCLTKIVTGKGTPKAKRHLGRSMFW